MKEIDISDGVSFRLVKFGENDAAFRVVLEQNHCEIYVEKGRFLEIFIIELEKKLKQEYDEIMCTHDWGYENFVGMYIDSFDGCNHVDDMLDELSQTIDLVVDKLREIAVREDKALYQKDDSGYYKFKAEYKNHDGIVEEIDDDYFLEYNEDERRYDEYTLPIDYDLIKDSHMKNMLRKYPIKIARNATFFWAKGCYLVEEVATLFKKEMGKYCDASFSYIANDLEYLVTCNPTNIDYEEFQSIFDDKYKLVIQYACEEIEKLYANT